MTVAQLSEFDDFIDVRSPSEFADDHVPGALSCPVLDDEERARVGTLYKQVSPFDARKLGAALVSRNIGIHILAQCQDRPRHWRPLVYCWRGGKRSGSFTHVLREIGFDAGQLDGGYRAYRRQVMADLETLPGRYGYRVVCGATGSGKTRLLAALAAQGAQVLDLEGLARHRGSVLGNLPDEPQPGQKFFDSLVWDALRRFDPARPVFVEAESRKIGVLRVPESLVERMWASPCLVLETPTPLRVALLKEDYAHFCADAGALGEKLDLLSRLHGAARVEGWKALARAGDLDGLVTTLLEEHYDPAYRRSTTAHYPGLDESPRLTVDDIGPAGMAAAARLALETCGA